MAGSGKQRARRPVGRPPAVARSDRRRYDRLGPGNDLGYSQLVYQPVVHTEDHRIVAAEACWSPRRAIGEPLDGGPLGPGALTLRSSRPLRPARRVENDGHAGRRRLGRSQLVAGRLSRPQPGHVGAPCPRRGRARPALPGCGGARTGHGPEPGKRLRPRLQELRRLGARIAIDGFGTGYSSLASLKPPIEAVKLDRSLVLGPGTRR